MDYQRQSTKLTAVEGQLELLPGGKAKKPCPPVDHRYACKLPNLRRAVRYSVSLADLEPKQIYEPLGMDKAIWSRIENGGMSFPADQLAGLAKLTGNQAPLIWLSYQAGYDLVARRDALEIENAELREKLAQAERDKALMIDVFRQVRG